MQGYRGPPETSRADGTPDNTRALDEGSALLLRLIPLPNSQSVGPLSLPPVPAQGGTAQPDPLARPAVDEPVASIVAQAASVLDDEMAKGVLAARRDASIARRGDSNANHPVLRQMHEFVDNLAALWPKLQGEAASGHMPHRPATADQVPLATVRPHAAVKPGEQAVISMALRNRESQPVRLLPIATDLLGSRGGRISSSLLEFSPSEVALAPQERKDLAMSATIPAGTAPGCYSGLLVLKGLDDLRALVTIEVAGTTAAAETAQPRAEPALRPAWSGGSPPAAHSNGMLQRAIRLAEDGELGNSDAIALLQIPHRPQDVKDVLARFDKQLTREARSKLTREAFAPLPGGVDNQRFEPIFDRHPITGKTYTTASGTVVLNEIQYYNGEMVQLYGECPNVGQVREALAGSGYKPLTMRHADGREVAIAQFWAHELTDTSLLPYNAAFVIVAAVPDDAAVEQTCLVADENGASSVLSMLDGAFDPATAVYENRARLFFLRLFDSTRVAVEVGRERMGTDKRPGTIQLARDGKRRSFSVTDGAGISVANIDFTIADDPGACLPAVAKAAATAGIAFRALPAGTEYVYPAVARIGTGPVVPWQWRSDLRPRLQRAAPGAVTFDPRSEAGEMLIRWGFEPALLGYLPNVRGVVTGLS